MPPTVLPGRSGSGTSLLSMTHPVPARRRPVARGSFNWVALLLLLLATSAAYLAWVWVPVGAVHYEAKQVVRDFMNQAIKSKQDDLLVRRMVQRLATLDTVDVPSADGSSERVVVVDVAPEDVTWERDASAQPPTLHVALEYTRPVVYPWIGKVDQLTLSVDLTQDMQVATWGTPR